MKWDIQEIFKKQKSEHPSNLTIVTDNDQGMNTHQQINQLFSMTSCFLLK